MHGIAGSGGLGERCGGNGLATFAIKHWAVDDADLLGNDLAADGHGLRRDCLGVRHLRIRTDHQIRGREPENRACNEHHGDT